MSEYKSLKNHVYEYIAAQISEGNLLPFQRINETIISRELNVSRTPVREALIQLSSEDILENVPRKGFILKPVTEREAAELYTVIGSLDGLAAQTACDLLTEKDLKNMTFYIDSMDLAIKTSNHEMYLQQQDSFHKLYLDKTQNEVLANTIYRLKSKFFTRGIMNNQEEQNHSLLSAINDEHREILRLFEEKDKKGVELYLRDVHWSPSNAHHEIIE